MRWLPHVVPYAAFAALPLLGEVLPAAALPWLDPVRATVAGTLLLAFAARGAYPELAARVARPGVGTSEAMLAAGIVGAVAGLVWIPLAELVPLTGGRSGFDPAAPAYGLRLALRLAGSIAVVPVAEELLVRSFVPRVVDASGGGRPWHERDVGRFTVPSFAASVGFFTLTHPEWLAALVVGILFTGLLAWSRRLRDVVLAHAVANAVLAAYVIPNEAWQWW